MPSLAERVDALERVVASLTQSSAAIPGGGRVSRTVAARMLSCSTRQVSRYAARGLLVPLAKPTGAAANAATYFDPANVRALAESEDAAREWVVRRKYVPKTHRLTDRAHVRTPLHTTEA